jgi:hypothetical protein
MRFDGFNNGKIALSQRDAATDLNVANRKTVAASFKKLEGAWLHQYGYAKRIQS